MKKTILTILLCMVIILGITGCGEKKKENNNTEEFTIIDKTNDIKDFVCAEALEKFYTDDNFSYYWTCTKNEYIVVKYKDGKEEKVSESLKNNKISITDLDRFNIKYIKESISKIENNTSTSSKNKITYNCKKNESGHLDFSYYYENDELVKVEYKSFIKGMPEEIEAKNEIKKYSGVTIIDKEDYVIFNIDIKNNGFEYLKDTIVNLNDSEDTSWKTIKDAMINDGYSCKEK